jgi:hypothetical protein
MAPRHILIAIVFGIAIGLGMYYVLGGNPFIHMAIAIVGAFVGAWYATRNMRR